MQKEKVLITDKTHPLLAEGLTALGFDVDDQPDIRLEEVRQIIGAYHGLIINSKIRVDEHMITNAPHLRFIGRLGSGMEIIDLKAAAQAGVQVFSAPEGNANAVAEHALGMLLCLANHLLRSDAQVRNFHWHREDNRGWELAGKTVGIVGVGHTGSAFAQKLRGMDVHLLGHDKYRADWSHSMPWIRRVSLEELQKEADVLSLHLPLTAETHHYMNRSFWEYTKRGVILLNTARGNQVDLAALLDALEAGQVGGACLDVFENEHPSTMSDEEKEAYFRLYALENVVLSPHIAGWTVESLQRIAEVLLAKISHHLLRKF